MPSGASAGSTSVFFASFFPTAQHRLAQDFPRLYALMQPDWLAQQCPEHGVLVGRLLLRNPALLPIQLAGAGVGLWGLCRLRAPAHAYLRHSLLFFLCMNLSSIVCHSLTCRGTALWHAALAADVAFTGASSLCLVAFQILEPPPSLAGGAAAAHRCWAVLAALLATAVANLRLQVPWVPEAIYIGNTAAALILTSHRLLWQRPPAPLLPYRLLAALGVALMGLCLPLDPLLCLVGGPWLGTTPLLFLGSNLGFAAIVGLAAGGGLGGAAPLKAD